MRGHGVAEATGVASDRNNLVLGVFCIISMVVAASHDRANIGCAQDCQTKI
jgi:hypothetical protein